MSSAIAQRAVVRAMSNDAQLVEYAGACGICHGRVSTSVQGGTSARDAAQDAALDHLKLAHWSVFAHLPVASIGQLVASIANTFTPAARTPSAVQAACR